MLLTSSFCLVNAQLKMNSGGNIGFGCNPTTYNKLEIDGSVGFKTLTGTFKFIHNYSDIFIGGGGYMGAAIYPESNNTSNIGLSNKGFKYIYAYNHITLSDARQKENIRDIPKALSIILNMRGVKYDLKKEYAYSEDMITGPEVGEMLERDRKNNYGFIAQELLEISPEVVKYDDSTDVYAVNYMQIIPLLVEAIKEQNRMILRLEQKLQEGNDKNAEEPDVPSDLQTMLGKNCPNPFSENTTIEYFLPSTVQKAAFYIYDLQGKQIKSMNVTERGQGLITIHGNELQPGMYHYTLIADGTVIGTEKMILTD